jgi:hypothetical protein
MTTYGVMQARIADELARTDLTTQIQTAILSAIKHHERREFYFNQKTATFSTVASQEYYGSSDLADIPNIILLRGAVIDLGTNAKEPLDVVQWEEIDCAQTGAITGDPSAMALFKQQIRLYPIPTAVRTITLGYVYRLTSLSVSADTNAWTTDAEELIRNRAKYDLGISIVRAVGDDELARWRNEEMEVLNDLKRETRMRRGNVLLGTDVPVTTSRYNINTDR